MVAIAVAIVAGRATVAVVAAATMMKPVVESSLVESSLVPMAPAASRVVARRRRVVLSPAREVSVAVREPAPRAVARALEEVAADLVVRHRARRRHARGRE
jgi:hypothetical protein